METFCFSIGRWHRQLTSSLLRNCEDNLIKFVSVGNFTGKEGCRGDGGGTGGRWGNELIIVIIVSPYV